MQCDFKRNQFGIVIRNIGNLKAIVTYRLLDWETRKDIPQVSVNLAENSSSTSIVNYILRGWIASDSTISIPMEISYDSENGGKSAPINFLKCGINKIEWR